jgi:hypothetical protein
MDGRVIVATPPVIPNLIIILLLYHPFVLSKIRGLHPVSTYSRLTGRSRARLDGLDLT